MPEKADRAAQCSVPAARSPCCSHVSVSSGSVRVMLRSPAIRQRTAAPRLLAGRICNRSQSHVVRFHNKKEEVATAVFQQVQAPANGPEPSLQSSSSMPPKPTLPTVPSAEGAKRTLDELMHRLREETILIPPAGWQSAQPEGTQGHASTGACLLIILPGALMQVRVGQWAVVVVVVVVGGFILCTLFYAHTRPSTPTSS